MWWQQTASTAPATIYIYSAYMQHLNNMLGRFFNTFIPNWKWFSTDFVLCARARSRKPRNVVPILSNHQHSLLSIHKPQTMPSPRNIHCFAHSLLTEPRSAFASFRSIESHSRRSATRKTNAEHDQTNQTPKPIHNIPKNCILNNNTITITLAAHKIKYNNNNDSSGRTCAAQTNYALEKREKKRKTDNTDRTNACR